MQTAAAEPALAAGPLDEQLTARLLQQRIIVLGSEDDGPPAAVKSQESAKFESTGWLTYIGDLYILEV